MIKKALLIGILTIILSAFAGCGYAEKIDTEGSGLIFSDSGTLKPINIYPSEWCENTQIEYSGSRISIFIDAGRQNTKYSAAESKYISIVNSIPVIVSDEFGCDTDTIMYKAVDYVYTFDNMEKYLSPTEDKLLNKLKYTFFYGSGSGIESKWDAPYEGHENNTYNTNYTHLEEFIKKDYNNNSGYENLYIIASSFTSGSSDDDADMFENFSSAIYRDILANHPDMAVGIAGFITETKEEESPYFIMALGYDEKVYEFLSNIDKANRQSFDENNFFVVYINQQIIKDDADSNEYNLLSDMGMPYLNSCTHCLCPLLPKDHYLWDAETYAANKLAEGQIIVTLPFSLPKGSSLDVSLQTKSTVSVVTGQRVYTGNISGLDDYGVAEGTISADEYDYVYSKIGPMSEKQRIAAINEKKQEYYTKNKIQYTPTSAPSPTASAPV